MAALSVLALVAAGCAQQGGPGQPGAATRPTYTPHVVRTARPIGGQPQPSARPASPSPVADTSPPAAAPTAASPAAPPSAAGSTDPGLLREALTRSLGSQNLQVTLDTFDDTAVRADGSPFAREEHLAAQFNGDDQHVTVRGTSYAEAGYDPARGLELIVTGGRTYIHGPAPAAKAPEDRWYLYPDKLPIDVANLWRLLLFPLAQDGYDFSAYAPAGEEELDGQQCRVFAHNDASSQAAGDAPGRDVRSAELRMWVCADGYLHKLLGDASYGPAPNSPNPASKRVELRLFAFDAVAPIAAPADAAPITP